MVRVNCYVDGFNLYYGGISIIRGQFRVRTKAGFPVNTNRYGPARIAIRTFEEKGADVNLATLLLRDAFLGRFDRAMVISNDSDLALAIATVVNDAGKPVHVTSPDLWVVNELQNAASSNGILGPQVVRTCQLPNPVVDADGNELHRPEAWSEAPLR